MKVLILALFLSLSFLGQAAANPLDYFGFTTRGMAMGSAQTVLADDVSANYYNPAGLVSKSKLQVQLGYVHMAPSLRLNGHDMEVDGVHGIQGGFLLPAEFFSRRFAVSLGLHLPNERVTRLRALPESQPRFALYDNHPQRLVLTTSFAFELIPSVLSLGLGLTYLANTSGKLDVSGDVDIFDPAGTELRSGVLVDFSAVRYLSLGLLLRPSKNLRVGMSFRDAFDLSLDIGVDVTGQMVMDGASDDPRVLLEGGSLSLSSQNSNLYSPRQISFAVAWVSEETFDERSALSLSFQVDWQEWSRFKTPTARLKTKLDLEGLPFELPEQKDPLDPQFHNTFIPRLGYEQLLYQGSHVALFIQAGGYFEPSPAPAQKGATNLVDNHKLGLGLGLSLGFYDWTEVFSEPLWLDIGGLGVLLLERKHLKDSPVSPTGDYLSQGHFLGLSTSLRFAF